MQGQMGMPASFLFYLLKKVNTIYFDYFYIYLYGNSFK